MPILVAFASLPFGLRGGAYEVTTESETVTVHVSELRYNPFLTVASRPELAQMIPQHGHGGGFTSYTWYDHPFVLRVTFGRNVASLGSINSCATVVQQLPPDVDFDDEAAVGPLRSAFAARALEALNNLIAVVRRGARLYHVFDLRREDVQISIRDDQGGILRDDPLEPMLQKRDAEQTERFDLLERDDAWYEGVTESLRKPKPVSLADDLLIEAERALVQRFPRQAIATCHTAMETGAASILTRGMRRRGIKDRQIDELLSTRSLASKLDILLLTYTGTSLRRHNRPLWKVVNELGDLRNDIVHRGRRPVPADAEFALRTARELLDWLAAIGSRLSN